MYGVKRDVRRFALAALAVVGALFLRRLLDPLLGAQDPYHTIWLAIVFSAWYCGTGPSIVAVLMAAFGLWYWSLPPYHSLALKRQAGLFRGADFLGFLGRRNWAITRDRHNRPGICSRAGSKIPPPAPGLMLG